MGPAAIRPAQRNDLRHRLVVFGQRDLLRRMDHGTKDPAGVAAQFCKGGLHLYDKHTLFAPTQVEPAADGAAAAWGGGGQGAFASAGRFTVGAALVMALTAGVGSIFGPRH